jgi:hypothetical protein
MDAHHALAVSGVAVTALGWGWVVVGKEIADVLNDVPGGVFNWLLGQNYGFGPVLIPPGSGVGYKLCDMMTTLGGVLLLGAAATCTGARRVLYALLGLLSIAGSTYAVWEPGSTLP